MSDTFMIQARDDIESAVAGRDIQVDNHRLWMTEGQLERAALRLTMKTRLAAGDPANGRSDQGTDAALVADAYLKRMREDDEAHAIIHRAAKRLSEENPLVRPDLTKLRMLPTIQLASGAYFDFIDPSSTPLAIEDIATGLSRICRYTGQLPIGRNEVYTVAQHSVLASENCDEDCDPFEALMHDRFESVGNDMASPMKQLLPCYKEIESRCEEVSAKQFGVAHPMSDPCKRIDLRMLATEKRDLMPPDVEGDETWAMIAGVEPLPFEVKPWGPAEAYHRFLHRFNYLQTGALPQITDPFGWPHPNAPAAYVAVLEAAWGVNPWTNTARAMSAGMASKRFQEMYEAGL